MLHSRFHQAFIDFSHYYRGSASDCAVGDAKTLVWLLNLRSSSTIIPKSLSEVLLEIGCLSSEIANIQYCHCRLFLPKWKTLPFSMLNVSLHILVHLPKQSRSDIIEATRCCVPTGQISFKSLAYRLSLLVTFLEHR